MEVAREERAIQLRNYRETSNSLDTELRDKWRGEIDAWHAQEDLPKKEQTAKNPYSTGLKKGTRCSIHSLILDHLTLMADMLTEEQVRSQLQEQEREEEKLLAPELTAKGRKSSQTMFLTLGLRLEESQ